MSLYTITFSPTGGTDKVTDILSSAFGEVTESISLLPRDTDYSKRMFTSDDLCLIAVPSYGGRVPAIAIERLQMLHANQTKAVLICVYGNRAYEDTLLELKDVVRQVGFQPIAAIAANAQHSIMPMYGQNRPDAQDEEELRSFAEKIANKLEEGCGIVEVPGNHPYKDYGGVPLKPKANKNCNACGLCAKACPVGAIDPKNPKDTDKTKCITCMHCVHICPSHARSLNHLLLSVASKASAKAFEGRKPNDLFIG